MIVFRGNICTLVTYLSKIGFYTGKWKIKLQLEDDSIKSILKSSTTWPESPQLADQELILTVLKFFQVALEENILINITRSILK